MAVVSRRSWRVRLRRFACLAGLVVVVAACKDDDACDDGKVCPVSGPGSSTSSSSGTSGETPSCTGGTTACNGGCADLSFDERNCGSCGRSCTIGKTCSGGICR